MQDQVPSETLHDWLLNCSFESKPDRQRLKALAREGNWLAMHLICSHYLAERKPTKEAFWFWYTVRAARGDSDTVSWLATIDDARVSRFIESLPNDIDSDALDGAIAAIIDDRARTVRAFNRKRRLQRELEWTLKR